MEERSSPARPREKAGRKRRRAAEDRHHHHESDGEEGIEVRPQGRVMVAAKAVRRLWMLSG